MATDFRPQFWEGYRNHELFADCPYILTSNCADAWTLGRFAYGQGLPSVEKKSDLTKSRGYTWKLHGIAYRVEGKTVERIG